MICWPPVSSCCSLSQMNWSDMSFRHSFQHCRCAVLGCTSARHQFGDFFITVYIRIYASTPPPSLPPSFLLCPSLLHSSFPSSSFFSSLTSPFVPLLSLSFQSTFKLGLSFLPLANAGLKALEAWNAELPAELLKPHFRHILPYLDDYLKTLGVAGVSQ